MEASGENERGRVLTGVHFVLGNYACIEGALAAGCDFFAGYPITPANEGSFSTNSDCIRLVDGGRCAD